MILVVLAIALRWRAFFSYKTRPEKGSTNMADAALSSMCTSASSWAEAASGAGQVKAKTNSLTSNFFIDFLPQVNYIHRSEGIMNPKKIP